MIITYFQNSKASKYLFNFIKVIRSFVDLIFVKEKSELAEINALVQRLQELPEVRSVQVIRDKKQNPRKLIFQLLADVSSNTRVNLVKTAINLAVDTEWKLDALTNTRDWDCDVQVVKKLRKD